MRDYYDRTKAVLAEIDKRAAVTERTVTESQQQLLDTVTTLLRETAVPPKADAGEQFGQAFMQAMLQDPAKAPQLMDSFTRLMDFGKQQSQEHKGGSRGETPQRRPGARGR